MGRLVVFELEKIWKKRSFQFLAVILLGINLFFQWYANLGNGRKAELSSYRMFAEDIRGMSEEEKGAFLSARKEEADGTEFAARILAMKNSETGAEFAEREMAENPGVFETWYDRYVSGDYLRYTDSLELETLFLDEMYEEGSRVLDYASYLESVQERKDSLSGISIFAGKSADSFASRNIKKSAKDYQELSADGICWMPSKTITAAMENTGTDILLLLSAFLFIGSLITEEKHKKLFYLTRSTRNGIGAGIFAKFLALFVHCAASSAVLYGVNYIYFGLCSGWCDLAAKIQSLAPYRESVLPISIWEFMLLSVLTKALVLAGMGAVVAALCILSENMALPYLAGAALWTLSWAMYAFIPAASKTGALKYLNLFAAMRTEKLYGNYLNLNFFGYPVSRTLAVWLLIAVVLAGGVLSGCFFFRKGERLQFQQKKKYFHFRFRPHASLLWYEGYKILFSCRGLVLLLAFSILTAGGIFSHAYHPAAQERYYQSLMLRLEGGLTEEKNELLASEEARYQEAFAELEKIDQMADAGEISPEAAESMKIKWKSVTAFYPAFQRVKQQSALVREREGCFLYDTGYLYLLGVFDGNRMSEFLLLTFTMILAFGNALPMEYETGAWGLLCASRKGKKGVLLGKTAVCGLLAVCISAVPFLCRCIHTARTFPLHGLFVSAQNIPRYQNLPEFIPVIALLAFKMLLQIMTALLIAAAVLLLSGWRKNYAQTVFFCFVLLCAPVVLAALGFPSARFFSLYPVYAAVF